MHPSAAADGVHYWTQGDGPFGGGEPLRVLLTYLDGGGSATF